jgi:hypothetical protein
MSGESIPPILSPRQSLESAERYLHFATKDAVYGPWAKTDLILPGLVMPAKTKTALWRGKTDMVFTHNETGEEREAIGVPNVEFSVVSPKTYERNNIPYTQLRFRIGMTALKGPIPPRKFLSTPDWRKQWTTDIPLDVQLIINYNNPTEPSETAAATGAEADRFPGAAVYQEANGQHHMLDLCGVYDNTAGLEPFNLLDRCIQIVAPMPVKRV